MRLIYFLCGFIVVSCAQPRDDAENNSATTNNTFVDQQSATPSNEIEPIEQDEIAEALAPLPAPLNWKNLEAPYTNFNRTAMDTVHIGHNRETNNIERYFSEERANVLVLVDEGKIPIAQVFLSKVQISSSAAWVMFLFFVMYCMIM